jgi:ABC-type multidrug transport system permease subunit
MRPALTAAVAVMRRDLQMAMSYRVPFASTLLSAFFTLTLFYYLSRLVRVSVFDSADAYYAFAVIGLLVLQMLNSTLQVPSQNLRTELVAGTFERIAVSPFGPVGTVTSMIAFPFLYSLFTATVMVAFAGIVFGAGVEWATLPLALPVSLLAGLAFAPFGMMLLGVVLVAKQALAGTTWLVAAIALVSGFYFPTTLLPDWIEWLSDVQPFTPAVELLRHVIVGAELTDPLWLDLLRLAGFAAVLMPLAVLVVDRAVAVSRRRGTLTEY